MVFAIHMQLQQNILINKKDENKSENVGPYKNEKSILEKQDIEGDYRNLHNKSLNTKSHAKDS